MVGPSVCLERQDHYDRQTLISDRIRCLNSRLGSNVRRGRDWGPLVLRGETVAYQLPGSVGSLSCSENALSETGRASLCYSEWTTPQKSHM